jgi:ribosomal protein S18 acetylase RimI-like enzyme
MEIRSAGPGNYNDYCRLIHAFDLHFSQKDPGYFRVPGNPVRTPEFYLSLFGPDRGVLMAFEGGQVVGLVNYSAEGPQDYPSLVPRRILFVTILAVAQGHTRRGIGRALMAEAHRKAVELNCVAVELCVQDYNQEALAFYEAVGYRSRERILALPVGGE